MQFGVHLPHIGRKAGPDAIRRAAVQAEELGFADVWVSEHVILPKAAPYPPSPYFYEPILTLTWAAAATRRVRLGTSVLVLPMHHPVPIAKQLATLQCLSGGRVIFGIGVGWLEAEFAAMGVPFAERGRRMDESIALLRALWSDDPVSFQTRYITAEIAEMRMQPQPVAPIPIWVGGSSEKALARAVRLCEGWHGSRLMPDRAAPIIRRLRGERPEPGFAISLRSGWDGQDPAELRDRLAAYRAAGAGHILVEPADREIEDWLGSVEKIARAAEGLA
ncbi:MAG: LLM class F420-dependent oxidoreductase [Xanthobacteraceae bacterium]|jgi:probable F420-dependent oxidoreductase